MFTGIVEEVGIVEYIDNKSAIIKTEKLLENAKIGDSIAVDGSCLTITQIKNNSFCVDISPETFSKIKQIKNGDCVNLERAMPVNGRFDGHIVTGHIDNIGVVKNIIKADNFINLIIKLDKNEYQYVVKKGSVTVNGISLTIPKTYDETNSIELAIIPVTYQKTNLKSLKVNDKVNIEVDILAKYIEKFLSTSDNKTNIDEEFLRKNGF